MTRPAFALLLIAALALLFFVAEVSGLFVGIARPIGEVRAAQGAVNRLPGDDFVWYRMARGGRFAQGDAIATGESSTAVLALSRGGTVELPPGALVVFRESEAELKLEFLRGRGRRSSPVSGELAEFVVEEARIAPARDSIFSGGALLSVERLPPVPELLEPGLDSAVDFDRVRSFVLRWRRPQRLDMSTAPARYELAFGPFDADDTGIRTFRVAREEFRVEELPAGRYVWSVRSVGADGSVGPFAPAHRLEVLERRTLKEPRYLPPRIESREGRQRGR
ncbi:MAG: hypothetical protein NDJ89_04165 [Oligoflexia bacterium]|nr:hypothetical protein [Oligoflexia bacterium]